jgi:hypothetical protein
MPNSFIMSRVVRSSSIVTLVKSTIDILIALEEGFGEGVEGVLTLLCWALQHDAVCRFQIFS